MIPYELPTERLTVRCYRPGDAEALWEAVDESREHLRPWLPWVDLYQGVEAAHEAVRRFRGNFDLKQDFVMAIFDGDRLVGGTGLHRVDWDLRRFEIGYWLRASATGKGYVTESTAALTRLCLEGLNANRVEIFVVAENRASRAVPERLGFQFEGIQRNASLLHGEPRDRAVYSKVPFARP